MREMADPVRRYQALVLYRQGRTDAEVATALNTTVPTLKRELDLDPEWYDMVQEAQAHAFEPVLERALELALQADAEGELEGAHKAMAEVFRHYNKQLDRANAKDVVKLRAAAAAELEEGRPPSVVLPGLVPDLIAAIKASADAAPAELELPSEEDDDDAAS